MKILRKPLHHVVAVILVTICVFYIISLYCTYRPASDISENMDDLKIIVASDLHYLSPKMTDYGDHFMEIIARSDGKLTHYSPEIISVFVEQVLLESTDVVVLSGDLTLNGDAQSHEEMAELLQPLADAGIKVLVIPGNHDVDGTAYKFIGDAVTAVAGASSETFSKIYENFGYKNALSRDKASLSYTSEIEEKVWLMLIDVNGNGTAGTITDETLKWAEKQLKRADRNGITVIGVSHQNLLVHNSVFSFGYQINNADKLIQLYSKYGVNLNMSGHLHIQHIEENDNINDIATSSLAVTPNQYGILNVSNEQSISYNTKSVDVSAWAERTGVTNRDLLNFKLYSEDFFNKTTRKKIADVISESNIPADEYKKMEGFAVKVNNLYFSGKLTEIPDIEALRLWQTKTPEGFFTIYIESMLRNPLKDMNNWNSQEKP